MVIEKCLLCLNKKLFKLNFRIALPSLLIFASQIVGNKIKMAKRSRSHSTDSTGGPSPKKFKIDENAAMVSPNKNVPQLNDDCLLEIFSYLSATDLCAVRDCSRRLWGLAETTVEKIWKRVIHAAGVVDIAAHIGEELSIVAKFGKLIPHLSINDKSVFFQEKADSLGTALEYCTSLKTLKLRAMDLSLIPLNILKNIEELELGGCTGGDRLHFKIIKACKMLKHLKMAMNPKERLVTAINELSNIESVCWIVCWIFIQIEEIEKVAGVRLHRLHVQRLLAFISFSSGLRNDQSFGKKQFVGGTRYLLFRSGRPFLQGTEQIRQSETL